MLIAMLLALLELNAVTRGGAQPRGALWELGDQSGERFAQILAGGATKVSREPGSGEEH
jgi:hypothetical protein